MTDFIPTPSAIIEPYVHELTNDDQNVMARMMLAAIDANSPEDFDRIVNDDMDMQRVLLRWRGDLTLSARAFYRQTTRAYQAAVS